MINSEVKHNVCDEVIFLKINKFSQKENINMVLNIVIFVICLIVILARLFFETKRITEIVKILSSRDTLSTLERTKLAGLAKAYKESIKYSHYGVMKSNVSSSKFFSEHRVLKAYDINTRILDAGSGILIGFGVFGTILVITLSIWNIKDNSSIYIQTYIQNLLNGIGTACITFLLALTTAIAYNLYEKKVRESLSEALFDFCEKLDRKFFIDDVVLSSYLQNQITEKATTDFVNQLNCATHWLYYNLTPLLQFHSADGRTMHLSIVLRDLLSNNQEVMRSLNNYQNIILNSVKEVMERVIDNMEEFKSALFQNTTKELEKLAISLGSNTKDIYKIPDMLSPLFDTIQKTISEVKDSINEISGSNTSANSSVMQQMQAIIAGITSLKDAISEVKKGISLITQSSELSLNDLTDNLTKVSNEMTSSLQGGVERFHTMMQTFVQSISNDFADKQIELLDLQESEQEKIIDELNESWEISFQALLSLIEGFLTRFENSIGQINTANVNGSESLNTMPQTQNNDSETGENLTDCLPQSTPNDSPKKKDQESQPDNSQSKAFFDRLLERKGFVVCPLPLWKLKITDEEYEDLRKLLANEINCLGIYPFGNYPREACLFFGEFWRREYVKGSHSKKMVFEALNASKPWKNYDYEEKLYSAAKRGAKILGIENFEDGNRILDDLLYQGGLPLQQFCTPETNSRWDRFITGLVFRDIDFDQLNLGVVAKNNKGLREFCTMLYDAVEKRQIESLPYYCKDETDPRYHLMLEKFSKVERTNKPNKPFSLTWEFDLNSLDERMAVKYDILGQQSLSNVFLEQNNLKPKDFIPVQVKCNSMPVDSFDFQNGFCRYEIRSRHLYHNGDQIAIHINDDEKVFLSESLDLSTPHIMYQTENGKFVLGNRLGRCVSAIIFPESWDVENESKYNIESYKWDGTIYRGMILQEDWSDDIVMVSNDGKMTFGYNKALYWTEIVTPQLPIPSIREAVFNAANMKFRLCSDRDEEWINNVPRRAKFRNKRCAEWSDTPSYGELFASVKNDKADFVTSVKLINVGSELSIKILNPDTDKCCIKIKWPYGKIFTKYGDKQSDDTWIISRKECEDLRDIPFIFTPTENPNNAFTLNVKAPFRDFSICDDNGNIINNDIWLPYSDLDRYQYHLAGMDIKKFTVGGNEGSIVWSDDQLYLNIGGNRKLIPNDGQLTTLLESREEIRAMLDKSALSILDAQVEVVFHLLNGQKLRFFIKESPYRPKQEGNTIKIFGNNDKTIDYKRALKLYKLDDPTQEPETLHYDEINGYVLPEKIKDWGKLLLTGRMRGRIYPTPVGYNGNLNKETHEEKSSHTIESIIQEIDSASFGDATWKRVIGWFNVSQKEDLPASSFLDLACTARKPELLIKLVFQLYCEVVGDEEQELINRLKCFSDDLAFQWYWILPIAKSTMALFEGFIKDIQSDTIRNLCLSLAYASGDLNSYLSALHTDDYHSYCQNMLVTTINKFTEWIKTLYKSSMQDAYEKHERGITLDCIDNIINDKYIDYDIDSEFDININQWEDLDDETKSFFLKYYEKRYSRNENWMMSRVKVIAKHLKGDINLFDELNQMDEHVADKIRRSLIFCYKETQRNFVFELNRILSQRG